MTIAHQPPEQPDLTIGRALPDGVWPQAWVVVAFSESGARLYHRIFAHAHTAERHAKVAPRAAGAARVEIVPVLLRPIEDGDR